METKVAEIAAGVYRLSTFAPDVAPPAGFTFNQFLIDADEPMLFHCGHRQMFPLISAAVARITPLERLRWISFGHVEADESGAMNLWLQAAPNAQVAHGALGCNISIGDLADRPPRALAKGEVIDLGGKRMRWLGTPHVPHGWEAGVFFEESGGTLFCGDLLTHVGDGPAITSGDVLGPAIGAEGEFHAMSMTPATADTLLALAQLAPARLAIMHGSSFEGDSAAALRGLADFCAGAGRAP
jgi:flavorubredoxin